MLIADSEFVSPQLLPALVGTLVFVAVGMLLMVLFLPAAWKLVDRITPGVLGEQIVPVHGQPNRALADIVGKMLGAMILGMALIIAAAIH